MKNGHLRNDFMRYLSSYAEFIIASHRIAEKIADDHQVQVLQLKEPNVAKREL